MKINESKIAFICFLLFSFIFPNRDFSKGYKQKNKKIFASVQLACRVVSETPLHVPVSPFRDLSFFTCATLAKFGFP
jgi:hypothetical protein